MRCLVIRQPWASLIASGRKTIELRSWSTGYRGPVLILAGAKPWKGEHGFELGPIGVALCVVDLVGVRPATLDDKERACVSPPWDWFAWELANPRAVAHVPVRGLLGLYAPTPALLRAVGLP
jgi:hypothetical protein